MSIKDVLLSDKVLLEVLEGNWCIGVHSVSHDKEYIYIHAHGDKFCIPIDKLNRTEIHPDGSIRLIDDDGSKIAVRVYKFTPINDLIHERDAHIKYKKE